MGFSSEQEQNDYSEFIMTLALLTDNQYQMVRSFVRETKTRKELLAHLRDRGISLEKILATARNSLSTGQKQLIYQQVIGELTTVTATILDLEVYKTIEILRVILETFCRAGIDESARVQIHALGEILPVDTPPTVKPLNEEEKDDKNH